MFAELLQPLRDYSLPAMTENSRTFNSFAEWLTYNRERSRYSGRALAKEVGKSHTYVANFEADPSPPSELTRRPQRDFIESVARITGADVKMGLMLGGWIPDPDAQAISYVPLDDPDFQIVAESWDGIPSDGRKLLRDQAQMLKRLSDIQRAGAIGRRVEDGEE